MIMGNGIGLLLNEHKVNVEVKMFGEWNGTQEIKGVTGSICPKCDAKIKHGQYIKQINGIWEHEFCLKIVSRKNKPRRTKRRAKLTIVSTCLKT
jgi:hypothetical protein